MFSLEVYSAASSILTGLLSFLCVALLTLEWRFPARTMRVLIPLFLLFLTGASAAYFAVCGVSDATKMHITFFHVAALVSFSLAAARYPLLELLSSYITACIFTFVSDTVCGVLVPEAGRGHVLVKIVVFLATAALLACFLRRPLLQVQREIQRRKWLWMMAVPLLMCVILFYNMCIQGPLYEDPALRPVALALCFCVVSVYVFFYFVLCSLQKQYQLQAEAAVLEVHLSSLKKHAETMRVMNEQQRQIQHDLRHYLRIQTACLEQGDLAGMEASLASLSKNLAGVLSSYRLCQETGQPLVDAVLSYYAALAETAGIDFSYKLQLPETLDDFSELAVMLSNALENAANACLALPAQTPRTIRLTGGVQRQQFLLKLENTCGDCVHFDEKGYPAAQRSGHGYGTQNIVSYAQRHRAQLDYHTEGGMFRLRFLMPLPDSEPEPVPVSAEISAP